jgi:outer membrane protein OmpA-like peptidoglycan-associated protein
MRGRGGWRQGFFGAGALVLLLGGFPLRGEEFLYKHTPGDQYRILSTVEEEVYLDRRLSHRAEILNRIAVEVRSVREGLGRHEAVFQTAERATGLAGGRSFQWQREYDSVFDRDRLGRLTIDRRYYMPVVRNVPVFPGRDLAEGDTWSAEGHEVHDFRDSFGISEPYRIPFRADYTFLGNREWRGRSFPAFSVSYRISLEPELPGQGALAPRRILGASDQVVYWDRELGQPAAYHENFRMVFELNNGRTVEYRGRAEAEMGESERMDKEDLARELAEDIARLGVEDAGVRVVDEGVSISLEDIRFGADSAELLPSELEKLEKIGELLRRYGDRDLLVEGHTALAVTGAGRQELSRERAQAVAEYLIAKGVRSPGRLVVRGYGAEKPIADNAREEGRRRNRRVEIILLEN